MSEPRMLKVTQVRSAIGSTERQRATLRALGLTRLGKSAVVRDNPSNQGRIRAVGHLIEVKN
ncbi:50S ribosomal protein L30 [Candidatus Binatia bacterium]|nr:50S ribosomal protein L30 [Candidatus Binatia bacterium]